MKQVCCWHNWIELSSLECAVFMQQIRKSPGKGIQCEQCAGLRKIVDMKSFCVAVVLLALSSDAKHEGVTLDSLTTSSLETSPHEDSTHGIKLTSIDYIKRRRPTSRDSKTPIPELRTPKSLGCRKDLPNPTKVSISMHVSEISLVAHGQVTMAMYLRYSWQDFRLQNIHQSSLTDYVEVASSVESSLWLPDLYVPNSASVINPVIFVPSTGFRIYQNHTVFANQYILMELSCPFNYALFPMDVQMCAIALESFGYSSCEMNITWSVTAPLTYSSSQLSQFSFSMHRPTLNGMQMSHGNRAHMHRPQVLTFIMLKRQIMFYMMQIYIPSALFVIVSWISFLIPTEMAQGRMLLTITTMLTMVSLFAAGSEYVPKASYVKAIDVWMGMCTFLSFFAVVHVLVDVRLESLASGDGANRAAGTFVLTGQARRQTVVQIFSKYAKQRSVGSQGDMPAPAELDLIQDGDNSWRKAVSVASQVHKATVYIYPVVYVLFNIIYWSVCMSGRQGMKMGVMAGMTEH